MISSSWNAGKNWQRFSLKNYKATGTTNTLTTFYIRELNEASDIWVESLLPTKQPCTNNSILRVS